MTRVLALVTDLMDRSRVQGAASEGTTVELFRGPPALWAALVEGPALVLLDLTRPGVVESVPAERPAGTTVVGFGPHVDDELLARARAAGVDEVLPRSVFFRRLPAILAGEDPV